MKKILLLMFALLLTITLIPSNVRAETDTHLALDGALCDHGAEDLALAESLLSTAVSSDMSVMAASLSVDVSISVQKGGENILYSPYYYSEPYVFTGMKHLTVYSDAAEAMGYTDGVASTSGVSLLDVLVTAHRVYYNKTTTTTVANSNYDATKVFNINNCGQYLNITNELRSTTSVEKDYVTRLFGYEVASDVDWVFSVNGVRPNLGLYPCGAAYQYTSITNTVINANDSVVFYVPSDATYEQSSDTIKYGASNNLDSGFYRYDLAAGSTAADGKYQDMYVWMENSSGLSTLISAPLKKDLTLTIKGFSYLSTYGKYGTFEDYQTIAEPVSGVKIGLLNTMGTAPYNNGNPTTANGTITPVGEYVSDADGNITISKDESFLQTAGTYTLVAYRTAADGEPVLMHTTTLITSKSGLDPVLDGYVAPEELTIVVDESQFTLGVNKSGNEQLIFVGSAKNKSQIEFKAVDQNGEETPVIWSAAPVSGVSFYTTFEDAYVGTASVAAYYDNILGYKGGTDFTEMITATSRLNGKTATYKLIGGTAQMTIGNPLIDATYELTGSPKYVKNAVGIDHTTYASYGILDYTVAYTPNDPSILQIDGGLDAYSNTFNLTFNRPGTVTFTIFEKNNPYHSVQRTITITGVVIENEDGTSGSEVLYTGETTQLTDYVADPENTSIAWSSSDEGIATVDSDTGRVTAVAVGTATIMVTCTPVDGDPYTGTYVVSVRDADVGGLDTLMISGPTTDSLKNFYYYNSTTTTTKTPKLTSQAFSGDRNIVGVKYTDCYTVGKDLTFYINSTTGGYSAKVTDAVGEKYVLVQPSFGASVKTELYVNGELVKELESDKATQVPLTPGTSTQILIKASSISNPSDYKEYKFTIVFPESTLATFGVDTQYVSEIVGRNRILTLEYSGKGEGYIFNLNADGTLDNSQYNSGSGFDANSKAFLYGDVEQFSLCIEGGDAGYTRLRSKVGDGDYTEYQGVMNLGPLEFGDSNEIVITLQSLSDKVYRSYTSGDPWSDASVKTRTLTIVRLDVDPTLSDFTATGLTFSDNVVTTPKSALTADSPAQTAIINKDAESVTARFKVSEGVTPTATGAEVSGPDADGYYTLTVNTATGNAFAATVNMTKLIDGYALNPKTLAYTLTFLKADTSAYGAYLADSVVDYLCVGSQYTNGAQSYGNINGEYPERTLLGISNGTDQISLGSFGGYATYYFADSITDDPDNPYGVDFTVYGYGTSGSDATRAKPGAVYVSEDGSTWYELAGSEHYDSNAIWDYAVTYTDDNEDGSVGYSDNYGRSGSLASGYGYPLAEKYTLHHWTDSESESMTFSGTLLLGSNGWDYSTSGTAAATKWGYAGTKITPTAVSMEDFTLMTGNPYAAKYQSSGSGFDLAWAVDGDGKPVSLTSVKYVKVMSSSLIQSDGTDESSAVVYSVAKSASFSDDSGTTASPTSIKIGDQELELENGVYIYAAKVSSQDFTVLVDASKNANVYINNTRGNSREYSSDDSFDFEKGILRIVVQEDESAPLIYYVQLTNTAQKGDGFTDVDSSAWYANAVKYVVDAGLFLGVSNDKFAPESELTRAMLVTVLYRAEESPAVTESNIFTDVGQDLYYTDAVIWASANNLINGIGNGQFAPEENITRQELVTILYRYAHFLECDIADSGTLDRYKDVGEIAEWAGDAMKWAVSTGIVQGTSDTRLSPNQSATRAEVAMMLMRLFENVL